MIRIALLALAVLSQTTTIPLDPGQDVVRTEFPARVWVAPPKGMRLVCADDYPNGAIGGSGPDTREIKLRRGDLETSVEVRSAAGLTTLKTNATLAGHRVDMFISVGSKSANFAGAKFVEGSYGVKVSLSGPAANRAALERFLSTLRIRSFNDVSYTKSTLDRVVYDGRGNEGAYLPFYETRSSARLVDG